MKDYEVTIVMTVKASNKAEAAQAAADAVRVGRHSYRYFVQSTREKK